MVYLLHIFILINIYIILTMGSNIIIGWANMFSICQSAFYGMGAYITANAIIKWHMPLIPALLIAIIGCAIIGVLYSLPLLKLKDDFFFLGTLALQMVSLSLMNNSVALTNGRAGMSAVELPRFFGAEMKGVLPFFILSTFLMLCVSFLNKYLEASPFARVLRGLSNDEIALQSLGKNVRRIKMTAFGVSAAFMATGGFLYATYYTFIEPTGFSLDESFLILTALIIGGTGSYKGAIFGACLIIFLPEGLRFAGFSDTNTAVLHQIIFGLLLIVLMRYLPRGIFRTTLNK